MKSLYLYLIIPAAMLAAFLFTPGVGYFAAQEEIKARIAAKDAEIARIKAEEDARQREIEIQAEKDAVERQRKRDADEAEKVAKREREYQEIIAKLNEDIATYSSEAEKLQNEANALDLKISETRTVKENANRDTFDLAKQVELEKIRRRTAELEIQRMVDMVAQRLNASPLSAPPPPPPPPAK